MYSNLLDVYQNIGETTRAKTEAVAVRAAFLTGVMEQGYRLWLTLLSTEMNEAVRAAQDLAVCKTPVEVAEVQSAWLQASSARAITSLQGTIEITNFLIRNLQDSATSNAVAPAAKAAAPAAKPTLAIAPAPVVLAAVAPAPVAHPAAKPAAAVPLAPIAPTVSISAPAPAAVAAPAPAPVAAAPVAPAPAPIAVAPVAAAAPASKPKAPARTPKA